MPIATRANLQPSRSLFDTLSAGSRWPWRSRHYFVAAGLWRPAGLGGPHTSALPKPWPHWFIGSAAGTNRRRSASGAKITISRFLPGGSGDPQPRATVRAAGYRWLRRDLRSFACCRSCCTRPRCIEPPGRGRHIPAATPTSRRRVWRILHCRRVRHRRADRAPPQSSISRARPLLRAPALSQQTHGRTALARHPCVHPAEPLRRHVWLRQPRWHRSKASGACRFLSCITTHRHRSRGARGHCPSAMSR